ncbi:MAG TPA: hypothetical protein VMW42_05180 [Desulfatiglandales bacterium]|nr:hypothetical protein [Desulfatiglandales bacterium]
MPKNGHLSNIRLIEEVARQKGYQYADHIFAYHDESIIIYLDDENRIVRVKLGDVLVCQNNTCGPEEPCFYNGPWFSEIEKKFRAEIEKNQRTIEYVLNVERFKALSRRNYG